MTDIYAPYRAMLAGKEVPIIADEPYPGRYKMKRGDAWLPVAIGYDEFENLTALVDGKPANPLDIWTWCAKWPVTQDAYKFRKANGHWPDEPKPIARSNRPTDPFEALLADVQDKSSQAEDLLSKNPEIKTQVVCDLFRNLQAQLLDLNRTADAMHEGEKRPVLEKGKEIDERFRFRAAVKVLSERLRQRFGAFLAIEERRQREAAQREFEAKRAAAEAERKRIEAERAKLKEDEPIAFHTSPEPELPELPIAPEPVKVQAGGGFGRKAGLRTDWVPEITDYKLAALHVIEHDDVKAAVEKVIARMVKAAKGKVDIPGVAVQEVRKAA
jgi:hypothetical protein